MKRYLLSVFLLLSFSCLAQTITSAEYFFNTDPGIGNGTSLSVNSNTGQLVQSFSIATTGLTDGFNTLYIRTLNSDSNWSLYDKQSFYLKNFNTSIIASAEYFFNTDPGIGNGTSLSVNSNTGQLNQVFSIPATSLSEGFHNFYLRTQNSNGDWSLYDRQIIYIKDFDLSPDEVSAAEYFIDSDPGIGNGTSIVFGDASLSSQTLNIDSTGLANGDHLFYVRVQDTNGDWSIYDTALFTIDSSLGVDNNLLSEISLLSNPFENDLSLKIPSNIQILKTKIYNNLGQTVYSSLENKSTLELYNLVCGLYILNLKTNYGNTSFKIIKK
ncbi:T9SS type A sorting domain-containing protein [Flavivirga abyssicola]|uniref:T9SS type A sorting domain-containing protein n=1 Tax=Flavivirga abyssicola TaxID=3063533 RepID=UPI0026DFF788|nr:T9SS type A sorting domain-containing protein [Flavivirga sp. MEBiC07777]WVK15136.1 T9SS type A sorting domain-containing protein [Flavivirga sp. MEBiC07777]